MSASEQARVPGLLRDAVLWTDPDGGSRVGWCDPDGCRAAIEAAPGSRTPQVRVGSDIFTARDLVEGAPARAYDALVDGESAIRVLLDHGHEVSWVLELGVSVPASRHQVDAWLAEAERGVLEAPGPDTLSRLRFLRGFRPRRRSRRPNPATAQVDSVETIARALLKARAAKLSERLGRTVEWESLLPEALKTWSSLRAIAAPLVEGPDPHPYFSLASDVSEDVESAGWFEAVHSEHADGGSIEFGWYRPMLAEGPLRQHAARLVVAGTPDAAWLRLAEDQRARPSSPPVTEVLLETTGTLSDVIERARSLMKKHPRLETPKEPVPRSSFGATRSWVRSLLASGPPKPKQVVSQRPAAPEPPTPAPEPDGDQPSRDSADVTLRFKPGEGLVAFGSGTRQYKDTIKTLGHRRWKFSRNLPEGPGWYVPRSRDWPTLPVDLSAAADKLRALGATVRVETEAGAPRSAEERLADQVERGERRAERLERRAAKLTAEGNARYDAYRKEADIIPFGQPVMGHRDRKRREKLRDKAGRAFAHLKDGEEAARQAAEADALASMRGGGAGYARRKLHVAEADHRRAVKNHGAECDYAQQLARDVEFWRAEVKRRGAAVAEATGLQPPDTAVLGDIMHTRWGRGVVVKMSKKSARVWLTKVAFPWDEYDGLKAEHSHSKGVRVQSAQQRTDNLRMAYQHLAERADHHNKPDKAKRWRRALDKLPAAS